MGSHRIKKQGPIIFAATPPPEPESSIPPVPDLNIPTPTKKSVKGQVESLYPQLKPKDIKKITEELWSHLEFDTPYARISPERLNLPHFTIWREWFWPERFEILDRMHNVAERNPMAKAAVMWTRVFVIGNGGMMTYRSKEAKEILEEFRQDPVNQIGTYEREFCDALLVDGEVFIRLPHNRKGTTQIAPLKPWHIHWIDTDKDNYKAITTYHWVATPNYFSTPNQLTVAQNIIEDIPAEEIVHIAINKYAYELRGRPDLLSALPWLRAYKDMLEERARVHRRKSIYYQVKVKNASLADMTRMYNLFQTPPPPGTVFVTNENVDMEPIPSNIDAGDAKDDLQAMKIMSIVASGLPEFFFSTGENSSLASATAQSVPALRMFDDRQDILEGMWSKIYRTVLQNALAAGRVVSEEVDEIDKDGEPTGKKIKLLDSFDYQYPELRERDMLNLARALQISETMGWSAPETNSQKMGFDYHIERAKIGEDAEENKPTPQTLPPLDSPDKNRTPDGENYVDQGKVDNRK